MSEITAQDGKRYVKTREGSYYLVDELSRTEPSAPQVDDTRPVQPSFSGRQKGGWGNKTCNACDDPDYIAEHFGAKFAGSYDEHPLNKWTQEYTHHPYKQTETQEQMFVRHAAEIAAAASEKQNGKL